MSEKTLQALRGRINARLQTSAISRDRASAAGREVVAQCRQSDVETLEWVLSEIDAVLATPEPGIALLRTPRGEGGGMYADLPPIDRVAHQLANIAFEELAREDYPSVRRELVQRFSAALAALRSEAQGEDRWEDLVFGPITEAYNEAHAARRGEGGGE